METIQNLTALHIYARRDNANYRYTDSARSYFIELRSAIYQELTQTGRCQLIDELLSSGADRSVFGWPRPLEFPTIPFLAMVQALNAVQSNVPLPPVDANRLAISETASIRWDAVLTKNPAVWQSLNFHKITCSQEDFSAIDGIYTQLKKNFRRPQAPSPRGQNQPSQENTSRFSREACAERDRILAQARMEAEQIRQDAQLQKTRILLSANQEADAIRAKAQAERAPLLQEAAELRAQAEQEAGEIRRQAEEAAHAEAQLLIQRELKDYVLQLRRSWEEEQAEAAAERANTSRLAADLKEDACTKTTAFGAELSRTITDLQTQLDNLRAGVVSDLQVWRASLYKCEYTSLVNVYTMLNAIANRCEGDAASAQAGLLTPEEAQSRLLNHSASLSRLRGSLTRAMEAMGLRQFTPQPGERFDSYYHATADGEDDDAYLDQIIDRCITPGIERVVNSQETAVLLRATVQVQPAEQSFYE